MSPQTTQVRPGEWRFRGPPPTDCSSLERGTPFSEGGGVPTAETVVMGLPHRPRFPPTETVSGEGAGELEGDDEPESHIFKRRFHYNKILYMVSVFWDFKSCSFENKKL